MHCYLRFVYYDNNSYTFAYIDEGKRISKTVNGVKTSYTYDGDMLISEYGSDYTKMLFQ